VDGGGGVRATDIMSKLLTTKQAEELYAPLFSILVVALLWLMTRR